MRDFDALKNQLDHIFLEFQLGDIERALRDAKANFLAAQGAMVCLEFLGGISNGTLGKPGGARQRIKEGVRLMGGEYETLGGDTVYALRNGLLHSYLSAVQGYKRIIIANDPAHPDGIIVRENDLIINVPTWVVALRDAYGTLLNELRDSPSDTWRAWDALQRLPYLS